MKSSADYQSLLNELDDDLMLELDRTIRQNQLTCLPHTKSGKAEAEILENYPQLLGLIDRSKRIKIDQMALRARMHQADLRGGENSKSKDMPADGLGHSPTAPKPTRSAKEHLGNSKSPLLKAKSSIVDLIFEMDEGIESMPDKTRSESGQRYPFDHGQMHSSSQPAANSFSTRSVADSLSKMACLGISASPLTLDDEASVGHAEYQNDAASSNKTKPWGSITISSSKLDMKDIMAQASSTRISSISSGLLKQPSETEVTGSSARLSQRERKKRQQQMVQTTHSTTTAPDKEPLKTAEISKSPWQVASPGRKVSLKDVLESNSSSTSPSNQRNTTRTASSSNLTLRQTMPGNSTPTRKTVSEGEASPAFSARVTSSPGVSTSIDTTSPSPTIPRRPMSQISHSTTSSHTDPIRPPPLPAEPSLQLTMAEILAQQQTEKDIIKETLTKRSLQEIQEEQAFQEWWDQESRKVMQEAGQLQHPKRGATAGGRGQARERKKGIVDDEGRGGSGSSSGSASRAGRARAGGGRVELEQEQENKAASQAQGNRWVGRPPAPANGSTGHTHFPHIYTRNHLISSPLLSSPLLLHSISPRNVFPFFRFFAFHN